MQPKVHILIYQSYLPFQGRYPRVSSQARILQQHGYDVTVLACDRECRHPQSDVVEGVPVRRIHVRSTEFAGPIRQLRPLLTFFIKATWYLLRHRANLLICHNLDVVPIGCAMRCLMRRKVIFDAHEPNYYGLWPRKWRFIQWLLTQIEKWMARLMHGITVTNAWQVEKYRRFGVRHVALIGNYARPDFGIRDVPEEKLSRETVTFGRLGTIYPGTGIEHMLAAFEQVRRSHPHARLLLAGRVVDKYRDEFERLIEPMREQIELIGKYDSAELPELYRQIDVSLLIYPRTVWFRHITPTKYYDSLANAVPVIMTDIGGLGEEIERLDCGLVVDENDLESIVAAMRRTIDDVQLRRDMTHAAVQATQSAYSWDHMEADYVQFVDRLIGRHTADTKPDHSTSKPRVT